VKIKKLDAELGAFKSQMAKLRDGPGKVNLYSGLACHAVLPVRALRRL
jgi:hypothetical protein